LYLRRRVSSVITQKNFIQSVAIANDSDVSTQAGELGGQWDRYIFEVAMDDGSP